jgi:hypothetical protein
MEYPDSVISEVLTDECNFKLLLVLISCSNSQLPLHAVVYRTGVPQNTAIFSAVLSDSCRAGELDCGFGTMPMGCDE